MRERKEFSREFKLEVIRQLEEGRKNPADLARELGIRRNQLYKWKELKESAAGRPFPGSGHQARKGSATEEIARLRREVEQLRQENEILKKAAAFFARELK